jgi:hypothetical protein
MVIQRNPGRRRRNISISFWPWVPGRRCPPQFTAIFNTVTHFENSLYSFLAHFCSPGQLWVILVGSRHQVQGVERPAARLPIISPGSPPSTPSIGQIFEGRRCVEIKRRPGMSGRNDEAYIKYDRIIGTKHILYNSATLCKLSRPIHLI